jgi:hypothetical protein
MNETARDPAAALTVQLLQWLDHRPRTHAEVMDAWKTSCPRLSIWEDACADGLVDGVAGSPGLFTPSPRGRERIRQWASP